MNNAKLIGKKMLALLDHPEAGRLQATVIALACMGLYSPPFRGVEVDADELIMCRDIVMGKGCFPLRTLADCVSAVEAALETHNAAKGINESERRT